MRMLLLLIMLYLGLTTSCATKPSYQDKLDCRKICSFDLKEACRSMFGGVLICECEDGTRYEVTEP
jgi:hypothetical protein